jgi:crossover junction endodeoxyribonuclease RusA
VTGIMEWGSVLGMLPFEFTVPGPPISHQSGNRKRLSAWRQSVRFTAAQLWGSQSPLEIPLTIAVTYYHERETVRIDNDNMLKPIQDALIGLVYQDDRLITDTMVRKTSIDSSFKVRGFSMVLLEALSRGKQFLHIVVDRAPSHDKPMK